MAFKLVATIFSIAILIVSFGPGFGKKLPSRGRILDPGDDSTIVNPPHSQPWAVGIVKNNKNDTDCSGTLISKKHVITSAHCKAVTHAVVGDNNENINDGEERMKVINEIPYPGWVYGDKEDLKILELEKEVTNKFAKPALLPKENERFDEYIVSGFGLIAPGNDSSFLRTVQLSDIGSNASCYEVCDLSVCEFSPDMHICGENLVDSSLGPCNGDSGGPWVVKNEHGDAILAGVHWAGVCASEEYLDALPHLAVRVSYPKFLRWMKKVTGL